MKFAILELSSHNHYPLIESWILCLNSIDHKVELYTDQKTLQNHSLLESDWDVVLKDETEKSLSFLRKAERQISLNYDYLIITSLQSKLIEHIFLNPLLKSY